MKCWYCGQETMQENLSLGKGWFKCTDCGATWIKMPLYKKKGGKVKK